VRNFVILYHNKDTEKLCKDFKYAKRRMREQGPEKLSTALYFVGQAEALQDLTSFSDYHLHLLLGDRKGTYSVDIG
jgi:plasmid maintenance system killer protein